MQESVSLTPEYSARVGKAVDVAGLTKVYPPETRAVDNVTFSVEEGEVFGMLGPNGAGKTTTIKMITTLAKPTSGSIRVFGVDALKNPQGVREMLAYVPQAISVDGDLTGYENLLIFAKLSYVDKAVRAERIRDALAYMGLESVSNELVKHYSGGMMRRLEIAQALVNRPRILFLDEPSIGLDPYSRRQVIGYVKQLNEKYGTTVFVTTHDMAEADELCDRLVVMNRGKFAAMGSPEELKRSVGQDLVTVKLSGAIAGPLPETLPNGAGTIIASGIESEESLRISTGNGERAIPGIVDFFEQQGVSVESISLHKPTLEDVFVKYAKASLVEGQSFMEARSARRSIVRHAK